jgi:succinyl-diaminopimelate desuccinylase
VDEGALGVLEEPLGELGFDCKRVAFGEVDNLYARIGKDAPNFCFAGHTDVVPPGDAEAWTHGPFAAEVVGDRLYGRGAADMKCAIASFIAAAGRFLADNGDGFGGSISLLITGDEEGPSINGTVRVLPWLDDQGETLDACLVGEPTSPLILGEMVKIGRRGSLTGRLCVHGTQGHSAYPELADNPIPRLIGMLAALQDTPLDAGTEHFPPSTVTITSVDVGNKVTNIIPARAQAAFNIRYNDCHSAATLETLLRQRFSEAGGDFELACESSGDAFLSPPGRLSAIVTDAVERITGRTPALTTTGGTSDARFIKDHCPVAEFGLTGETAHKVDENVAIADIHALADIYRAVLDAFFDGPGRC